MYYHKGFTPKIKTPTGLRSDACGKLINVATMNIKHSLSIYRQVFGLLLQYPSLSFSLIILSLCVSLTEGLGVGLLLPFLAGSEIDIDFLPLLSSTIGVISGLSAVERVRLVAALLVLIVLIRSGFLYAARLQAIRLQIAVTRYLRSNLFKQLHTVAITFIHQQRIGGLLEMLLLHVTQAGRLVKGVNDSFVLLFTIITYGILMTFVSWPLTLLAVGLLIGITIPLRKRLLIRIDRAAKTRKELGMELQSISVESLSAMRLIHLFTQEEQSLLRFDQALEAFNRQVYRTDKLVYLTQPLFSVFSIIILSSLLLASTFILPEQSEAWIGQLALFLVIVFRLIGPASALNQTQSEVINFSPALQSVLDFLRREDKPYLKDGSTHFEILQTGVALENVSFHYDSRELPALKNISFEISQGEMTAVVGPSGSGKSTLVNLLARLYDCDEGQISVDGVDLRDLEIASWRSQIAVVSQDIFIFNDTVMANLRFVRANATDDEIFQVARLAQAHSFITALPQGYETRLGDRGVRLSGGQQQRLAIARAMLVNPQLIIFDEATSDLDTNTEQAIQEAIAQYGQGRTVLVIAHRLSTIHQADNIIVLEKGRVVEHGTHQELMQQKSAYWQLTQVQSLEKATV